jgi:hypothetical protein
MDWLLKSGNIVLRGEGVLFEDRISCESWINQTSDKGWGVFVFLKLKILFLR